MRCVKRLNQQPLDSIWPWLEKIIASHTDTMIRLILHNGMYCNVSYKTYLSSRPVNFIIFFFIGKDIPDRLVMIGWMHYVSIALLYCRWLLSPVTVIKFLFLMIIKWLSAPIWQLSIFQLLRKYVEVHSLNVQVL